MLKVTLCGSTKFKEAYERWNRELSIMGAVVYSVASFGHQPGEELSMHEKTMLDVVHMTKIAESDCILVITGNTSDDKPYIGESTQREIYFTKAAGNKEIFYSHLDHHIQQLLGRIKSGAGL